MQASVICLRAALLIFILGLVVGLGMGMTQNFSLMPAHAHTNLAGFVVLFLFGLAYQAFPAMAAHRLARVQAWSAVLGAVVFAAGLMVKYGLHDERYEPVIVVGSLIFFASVLLFTWIAFAGTRSTAAA